MYAYKLKLKLMHKNQKTTKEKLHVGHKFQICNWIKPNRNVDIPV